MLRQINYLLRQSSMEHNNRVQFPPYLKRRLIYQAKRFGQFKCQVDFTSTGIAEFKFKSYDRDTFGAKRLLLQIIEEETQEYNRFLKEFKLDASIKLVKIMPMKNNCSYAA